MLQSLPYNESADIYSYSISKTFSLLIFSAVWNFFGREVLDDPNFQSVNDFKDLVENVAVKKVRPIMPKECPPDLASLLRVCWDSNPSKRFNCAQIIASLERIRIKE